MARRLQIVGNVPNGLRNGVEVLSEDLPPGPSSYSPYLIIGDPSGFDPGAYGWETGTFCIDEVVIKTYTACTP